MLFVYQTEQNYRLLVKVMEKPGGLFARSFMDDVENQNTDISICMAAVSHDLSSSRLQSF
jgi:hypothetical protein